MNPRCIFILAAAAALATMVGCRQASESAGSDARAGLSAPPAAAPTGSPPARSGAAAPRVARVVFLDQKKACACTLKRIEASWKVLNDVVGFPPLVAVERIHMDQAQQKAAPYKAMRPVMVPPAIYFLGKGGELLEVLQGEVTEAQVKKAL